MRSQVDPNLNLTGNSSWCLGPCPGTLEAEGRHLGLALGSLEAEGRHLGGRRPTFWRGVGRRSLPTKARGMTYIFQVNFVEGCSIV